MVPRTVTTVIADFSGRGPSVFGKMNPNVSAPGVFVLSSVPGNGYEYFDGTSMATPHVVGALALMMSANPDLSGDVDGVTSLLASAAVDKIDNVLRRWSQTATRTTSTAKAASMLPPRLLWLPRAAPSPAPSPTQQTTRPSVEPRSPLRRPPGTRRRSPRPTAVSVLRAGGHVPDDGGRLWLRSRHRPRGGRRKRPHHDPGPLSHGAAPLHRSRVRCERRNREADSPVRRSRPLGTPLQPVVGRCKRVATR